MTDGLLLIDKQAGPTSHDIVAMVRRLFKQKRVGHAGTLDPAATGLLVVLVGKATRFAQWLQAHDKTYEGAIRLGISTDTLDAQGKVMKEVSCPPGALDRAGEAARSFLGEQVQVPPQYSAVKVDGVPAYKAARRGGTTELKSRTVTVYDFSVAVTRGGDFPLVEFVVSCSAGTYIRSLAADFGAKLGCPAHLEKLRRLRIGALDVGRSITIDRLKDMDESDRSALLVPARAALDMPEVLAPASERVALLNGREFMALAQATEIVSADGPVKIISGLDDSLLGLGKIVEESSGGLRVKPFLIVAAGK